VSPREEYGEEDTEGVKEEGRKEGLFRKERWLRRSL